MLTQPPFMKLIDLYNISYDKLAVVASAKGSNLLHIPEPLTPCKGCSLHSTAKKCTHTQIAYIIAMTPHR